MSVDILTDAEKELVKAADEAAESFKESKEYYNEVAEGIMAETDHTKDLVSELNTLADSTGKVNAADQARVQFILDELNEALGTE